MPRHPRVAPGGVVYHALNRAVARLPLFETDGDFDAFERAIDSAQEHDPTRILAYCVMQPQTEAELAALRESLRRGRPYGDELWQRRTARRYGLEFTLRPPHRPRTNPR